MDALVVEGEDFLFQEFGEGWEKFLGDAAVASETAGFLAHTHIDTPDQLK